MLKHVSRNVEHETVGEKKYNYYYREKIGNYLIIFGFTLDY